MPRRLFLILTLLLLVVLALAACDRPAETAAPTDAPATQPVEQPGEQPAETAAPAPARDSLLISEVLAGVDGNNNHEFIELYNTSATQPFDLKGWSLWFLLADGQEEILVQRWRAHTLVPPLGHYLLARDRQDFGLRADMTFTQSMVPQKGALQLRDISGAVIDSLAWGDGPTAFAEAALAPAMRNGVSLERLPGGESGNFADSNHNHNDFVLNPAPAPQNSGSALTPAAAPGLAITIQSPEVAEPGSTFEIVLQASNQTEDDLQVVSLQLPIPKELKVGELPAGASLSDQDAFWGMAQIDGTSQVLLWQIGALPAGESAVLALSLEAPYTYMTAALVNYSAQAEGVAPTFGGPVFIAIEGGAIPIGTLVDLVGAELIVEGTATMPTGALYAGGGNVKFYLEDESGGVQVWVPEGEGEVRVPIGALVRARGKLEVYRGALELVVLDLANVETLAGPADNPAWTPAEVSVPDASSNPAFAGRLGVVEGLVTRVEEFSYSYEIDLMDESGETLLVYVDKQTNINVEGVEPGQSYRITGVIETYNDYQELLPRVQSDLQQVFPPVLRLELKAPITVASGETLAVNLTATNYTPEPLTNLLITGTVPLQGAELAGVPEGAELSGRTVSWLIPELAGNGASTSVSFELRATALEGYLTLESYQASAAEWPEPVSGSPFYVFLGETVPVWAIQGQGSRSPYVLDPVSTAGIVTAIFPDLGGFWIQEAETDQDPLTSAGLFIFEDGVNLGVAVGDALQLDGVVRETSQQTQLWVADPAGVTLLSSGNPLPVAVELLPPADELAANAYYEALEGMLVQVSAPALAVAPANKYGEYVLVPADSGVERLWQGDTATNGLAITVDDGSEMVHENNTTLPYIVNAGDRVSGLIGPLAYTFGRYKIEPVTAPVVEPGVLELPRLAPTASNEFSIMTWNVENLFDTRQPHPSDPPMLSPAEYRLRLEKVANTILSAGAPLVVGLQEVEHIGVLEELAAHELLAAYGYQPVLIEGTDSRFIDVGYLVRGDRVTIEHIEQFVAPEGLTSRPPLLVQLTVTTDNGPVTLFVLNNHFTSMSAGVEATEPRRDAQARWNVEVLQGILAEYPDAYVAVIGDLNSFYDSKPIDSLREAGLQHVFEILPPEEHYTYIYQGASQTLDHILVTPGLMDLLVRTAVLHVNADFSLPAPDDASPLHSSDHDPLVATFELK
ncbi:MAG: lamin tail domain-containing protein [Anaerolineales bacterium]|nr:lamin tail domain-containing protein [Anaerolineales bacterium]